MQHEGFEFDLLTQRFIRNRWETLEGKEVLNRIIKGIQESIEIRAVLDDYVLEHSENKDPYGHPYYPEEAMKNDTFWVLTQDDLCGINIYHEDFSNSNSLSKKSLNYARFYGCNFNNVNLERTSLTHTIFDNCKLNNTMFASAGGYYTSYIKCAMNNTCFVEAGLMKANFKSSDLSNAYFESAEMNGIKVNYQTILDLKIRTKWKNMQMKTAEIPGILKELRVAYEKAELFDKADQYLYLERIANRKYFLWHKCKSNKNIKSAFIWFKNYIWYFFVGYGLKPMRIWLLGLIVSVAYALIYYCFGNPSDDSSFLTSLYYSLTTFATLGYGDLSYSSSKWQMRLISTSEAWSGAILIATFVAIMARKIIRH